MHRQIGFTTVALVVTATALSAQSQGHGGSEDGGMIGGSMMEHMQMMHGDREGGGMGGGMNGGMGSGMASGAAATDVGGPGPARILGMVEELDLSADQIGQLGVIRERLAIARKEHQQAMETARESAQRALGISPPDLGAYEESLRQEADHRIRMQVAAARAGSEARGTLTPTQLEQLQRGMSGGMTGDGGGMSH